MVAGLFAGLIAATLTGRTNETTPRGVVVAVSAGGHHRRDCLVVAELPPALRNARAFTARPLDGGPAVPAQRTPGDPPGVAWVVADLPAGSTRAYRLEVTPGDGTGAVTVTAEPDGGDLVIRAGGRPVVRYRVKEVESPPGLDPVYRRSGYIHPLTTPSGRAVTGDFAPDHAHQHGLFFAWVNTTFEGRASDFWNQPAKTGRVRHVAVEAVESGPVFGRFVTRLRHDALDKAGRAAPALDETWTVRAFVVGDPAVLVVDFESRQTCAGDRPLVINKYHYGGLGFRGNSAWYDERVTGERAPDPSRSGASDFLTSEGKRRGDGNHTRPHWVDLYGKVEGEFAGVAVLDHPGNFRSPQPVRLHPNKPYFSVAPEVLGSFTIAPGTPYVSRYRLVVHDGKPAPDDLDRHWTDYADPPRVRVVAATEGSPRQP